MTQIGGWGEREFRLWLEANEPRYIAELGDVWGAQRSLFTRNVIDRSIRSGALPASTLRDLDSLYQSWLTDVVQPKLATIGETLYRERGSAIATLTGGTRPGFRAYRQALERWAIPHAGALVKGLTLTQRNALDLVLQQGISEGMSSASLARLMRSTVPLDARSAKALLNRRRALEAAGETTQEIERQARVYARQLASVRAKRIARTELATAYHRADHMMLERSVADGVLKDVKRTWDTADDERVCKICAPLDGVEIAGTAGDFTSGTFTALHPPIHPACRCTTVFDAKPVTSAP